MFDGVRGLIGHVDLALFQALQEFVGGKVNQFDVVGFVQNAVRHRFANDDAGNLRDDIVKTLKVLDIERGVYVNPSRQ